MKEVISRMEIRTPISLHSMVLRVAIAWNWLCGCSIKEAGHSYHVMDVPLWKGRSLRFGPFPYKYLPASPK